MSNHILPTYKNEYDPKTGEVKQVPLTESELAALSAMNLKSMPDYKALRAGEYPDFREYLDGVVKGDQVQIQAYIDACLAVKAKYPKPNEPA